MTGTSGPYLFMVERVSACHVGFPMVVTLGELERMWEQLRPGERVVAHSLHHGHKLQLGHKVVRRMGGSDGE